MGNFTIATKNSMLDSQTVDLLSLHSADPGADGLLNELSGGSPAYARKAAVFNAASGGERVLNADVLFDIPASATVAYVCKWDNNAGSPVLKAIDAVTSEAYAAQGQYKVLATTTKLTLADGV